MRPALLLLVALLWLCPSIGKAQVGCSEPCPLRVEHVHSYALWSYYVVRDSSGLQIGRMSRSGRGVDRVRWVGTESIEHVARFAGAAHKRVLWERIGVVIAVTAIGWDMKEHGAGFPRGYPLVAVGAGLGLTYVAAAYGRSAERSLALAIAAHNRAAGSP